MEREGKGCLVTLPFPLSADASGNKREKMMILILSFFFVSPTPPSHSDSLVPCVACKITLVFSDQKYRMVHHVHERLRLLTLPLEIVTGDEKGIKGVHSSLIQLLLLIGGKSMRIVLHFGVHQEMRTFGDRHFFSVTRTASR